MKLPICFCSLWSSGALLNLNFLFSFQIHSQEIEKTRTTLEQQKTIERVAIEEKLKTAQSLRDDNIKKMLERLKEHVSDKSLQIRFSFPMWLDEAFYVNSFIVVTYKHNQKVKTLHYELIVHAKSINLKKEFR